MKRLVSIVVFLIGILAAYAVTNEYQYGHRVRQTIATAILVLCLAWLILGAHRYLMGRRLRLLRGIKGAGLESLPEEELAAVWDSARNNIIAFGMGMTRLSKNEDLIRRTAQRGVRIRIILIDPAWIARRRVVSDQLGRFYDTSNIVGRNRDSYERLCRLRDQVVAECGAEAMEVQVYRNVIMMSATIADPDTEYARGFVEFHLFHAGDKRFRLNVLNYAHPDGRRSLISQVVRAIELAVQDVGNGDE